MDTVSVAYSRLPWAVRPSQGRGLGLFAVGGWWFDSANTLLFEYVGQRVHPATDDCNTTASFQYAVSHPHGHAIDAADGAYANEPARYINHATGDRANCEFRGEIYWRVSTAKM